MPANFASGTVWTGDNLDIMRGMNSERVDLIYLDPPFNSNRTYEAPIGSKAAGAAFKDAWTLDDVDVHEHGELADRNPAAYSVIEAARQAHGKPMQAYLIMMAVRLLEMRRILKDTGSIYVHCDPTASHYLKLLMDGIFGHASFRNEISWLRTPFSGSSKSRAMQLPRNHDVILLYAKNESYTWNAPTEPYSEEYLKRFKWKDERGYYRKTLLKTYSEETFERLKSETRLIYPTKPGAKYSYKQYLDESSGVRQIGDVWVDINMLNPNARERLGYPTQKPLALLERIIKASSDPGDMVLDPFCGCATALVAADRLQREWAGIDLSPLAIKLVNERIAEDRAATKEAKHAPVIGGSLFRATALTEPPSRTDLGNLPNYRTHRHRLYGEQEGVCVGCETHFPFRVMDVDHILPQSKGGTDHSDNLQLLCSGCNRSKGGRTMAEWRAAT